jgi:hypothetical protein
MLKTNGTGRLVSIERPMGNCPSAKIAQHWHQIVANFCPPNIPSLKKTEEGLKEI